eukprot:scaffold14343_cov102-Cylindrotheca_fusiformis.AAC.3
MSRNARVRRRFGGFAIVVARVTTERCICSYFKLSVRLMRTVAPAHLKSLRHGEPSARRGELDGLNNPGMCKKTLISFEPVTMAFLQLTDLELWNNSFSGTIPSEIGNLQQLKYLHLNHNIGLTGTVPVEVGQQELIWSALFQNTSLTGGLDDLAFCQNRETTEFFQLAADCGGSHPRKITCECCTKC